MPYCVRMLGSMECRRRRDPSANVYVVGHLCCGWRTRMPERRRHSPSADAKCNKATDPDRTSRAVTLLHHSSMADHRTSFDPTTCCTCPGKGTLRHLSIELRRVLFTGNFGEAA